MVPSAPDLSRARRLLRPTPFECVFLASGLDGANRGGIQCSAQIAWEGVQAECRRRGVRAALLSYGEASGARNGDCIVVGRWRGAVLGHALGRRWRARHVLVWHLGLAKLLPFLRTGAAQVTVFLHGIEAWRPLGVWSAWCLRRRTRFLSNSAFTWQRFTEANPCFAGYPHLVTHLGLDEPAEATTVPTEPPAALMLGRLVRAEAYKGHREVIAAWPRVRERVPGAELWIAGDGDLRSSLQRQAGDGVIFWGRVSEEKKIDLLARSRCLALPSRGEGFGLVYLEALRLGRPCLVSDCDAGREVVQPPEAGLAANPGDATALTEAFARLLTAGPQWAEWSAAAHRRYVARFTAAQFQIRLLEALFGKAAPMAAR